MGDLERKEWIKVSHSPGRTSVSITLAEGRHSVRWAVKSYTTPESIRGSVTEARKAAADTLDILIALEETL